MTRAEIDAVMDNLWTYSLPLVIALFYLWGFWGYLRVRAENFRDATVRPAESMLLVALASLTIVDLLPLVGHHDSDKFMGTPVHGWYAVTTAVYFLARALALPLVLTSAVAIVVEIATVSNAVTRRVIAHRRAHAASAVSAPVALPVGVIDAGAVSDEDSDQWALPLWATGEAEAEDVA